MSMAAVRSTAVAISGIFEKGRGSFDHRDEARVA